MGGAVWMGVDSFRKEDTGTSSGSGQPVGPAGAIGAAIDGVESLNNRYEDFDLMLGEELTLADVTKDDVLPAFALGIARSLGSVGGLDGYVVNVDDLAELEPEATGDWLSTLLALPQDSGATARAQAAGLPVPGPKELVIAVGSVDGRVVRLVAVALDPVVSVDVAG